jgi:hypothetical protein
MNMYDAPLTFLLQSPASMCSPCMIILSFTEISSTLHSVKSLAHQWSLQHVCLNLLVSGVLFQLSDMSGMVSLTDEVLDTPVPSLHVESSKAFMFAGCILDKNDLNEKHAECR